jgi:hypothetical protein
MTQAKAKAKTNETFIVKASLTINTYDHKNMFIVQATDATQASLANLINPTLLPLKLPHSPSHFN